MAGIREALIARIEGLQDLPVFSDSVMTIMDMIATGDPDVARITAIVEKDVALVARILKIANSTFYSGRYGEIGDIQQAVVRLGISEINKICVAMSTMNLFPETSPRIDLRDFWRHSLGVAMTSRAIIKRSSQADVGEGPAYIGGLLHDIGTLILDVYFPDIYETVRNTAEQEGQPVHHIEQKVLGMDHGEVGSIVLKKWQFPERIVEAVKWHHQPDGASESIRVLAQIVHLTDFACAALGFSEPGDGVPTGASVGAWHDVGLDSDAIQELAREVLEEIEKTGPYLEAGL